MQRLSKYIFLSRPRRFGKSLLTTTLCSFFEGERDLFEGLKVMELEKEWKHYPASSAVPTSRRARRWWSSSTSTTRRCSRCSTRTSASTDTAA